MYNFKRLVDGVTVDDKPDVKRWMNIYNAMISVPPFNRTAERSLNYKIGKCLSFASGIELASNYDVMKSALQDEYRRAVADFLVEAKSWIGLYYYIRNN